LLSSLLAAALTGLVWFPFFRLLSLTGSAALVSVAGLTLAFAGHFTLPLLSGVLTAVFVLELCNGRHEVHEMAGIFGETFKDEKDPAKAVTDIVNQFVQEGLVKIGE
jgi:hypothetical protein